jgi:GTP-binding protein
MDEVNLPGEPERAAGPGPAGGRQGEVGSDPSRAGEGEPDLVAVPVLAVVGRPNVGKSTLVNRILGSRQAVVEDTPGVTRDRVAYDATWRGRAFTLVDTGGWEPSVEGSGVLAAKVAAQARVAVDAADAVLFVTDAVVGVTDADAAVAAVLRRSRKPVVLAANKVDDAPAEAGAHSLWSLGLGEPYAVSALHGRGSGDLLDAILGALPETPSEIWDPEAGPRRVALIGRPNVGKSSLLNKLAGQERVLVDAVAGTTRDPVDELIELGGITWRFVDTAGIRRRFRETQGADYFAALRTERALERAEVAVVLVDASEPLAEQDLRIVSMVIDAGRALVIAYNKWDLVDEDRRGFLDSEIDRQLHTARWAPRVNISAATGWHVDRLVPALETALAGWEARVPTGQLNAWLSALVAATPPPIRGGKQPRIMFATQAGIRPPHFILFTSGFLQAGYRRFIERRLREEFGFQGTPVHLSMRMREKRSVIAGRAARRG